MTQISKKAYKGLPVSIKVRKPHYYYQDFLEVFNDNAEKYIELREFEGLDYSFNRSQVTFDEKVLWNGYTSPNMIKLLAPYSDGDKTDYNVTIIGYPYINNGIASGFNSSSFIQIPNKFAPSSNTWEVLIKVKTGIISSDAQCFYQSCSGTGESGRFGILCYVSDGKWRFALSTNNSSWLFDVTGTYDVQSNTIYWIKITFNGTKYELSYSLNGEDFIVDISQDSTVPVYNSLPNTYIGIYSTTTFKFPWLGLIYLNESYIKINDEMFWQPEESIVPNVPNYLTSVRKLVYNVVGSPTIIDNVVSNFSSSNYITTDYTFLPKGYSWVWQVKFMQTESFTTGTQYIMNSSNYKYSPYITILKDGTISATVSTNGAWLAGVGTSDFVVELNKYYWVRLEFDGVDTYSLKYSTDGQSYSLIGEVQNTSLIVSTDTLWFGKTGHDYTLHGKIDFNETFVEVNNEIVWGIDAINVVDGIGCLDNITDVPNERTLTAFVKDDEILLSESSGDKVGYTWANKVTIPQHEVIPVYKKKFSETNTNYTYTYQDENILVSLNPSGGLILREPLVFSFIPQTSFFDYDVRFTAKVTPVDATSYRVICVKDGVWFGTSNGKVVVDKVLTADTALTANTTYWVRMAETYSVSTGKYILRVAYIVDNGYTKETLPDESEWVVKSVIRDVPFFSNESTIATFGWTSNSYSWYGTMDLTNIWVDYGNITNIGDNTRIYETKWEMLEKV